MSIFESIASPESRIEYTFTKRTYNTRDKKEEEKKKKKKRPTIIITEIAPLQKLLPPSAAVYV